MIKASQGDERYRLLFERSLDAIYIGTPDGRVIDVNQAWLDLFGYRKEELAHVHARDFYAEPAEHDDFIQRMAATGFVHDEVRYRRKDGTTFDCERTLIALKDESGAIIAYQGVNRDVTRLRQARAALHDSEQRYHALFEQSLDATFVGTPDGRIIDVNQAWLDLFGYSRGELPNLNFEQLYVKPEDRLDFIRRIVASGNVRDEVLFRKKDGTLFDCERTAATIVDPAGNVIAIQGVNRDITTAKRAAEALRQSEARYRALFEHSMDAIALVSTGGLLLDANQAWLDLFGYAAGDIAVASIEPLYVNPDDHTRLLESLIEHGEVIDDEVQLRRRDGTVMECLRTATMRRDSDGNVIGVQSVVRDISERKRAEQALRRSEERFRSLFEHSMDAIYIGREDGTIIDVNQAWLKLFQYTRARLPDITMSDLYVNAAERGNFLSRMDATGEVQDEVRFKKRDGTQFDCERTAVALRDSEGRTIAFQGIMRDVTQRNRHQEELERLARFDTLTGLLNRRSILERVTDAIHHVRRYRGHLSVLMLDIDHFKRVNDHQGHVVGDRVLATIATLLQQGLRQADVVGRYGGEEFLVVLPHTACAAASHVAERMRRLVAATPMLDATGCHFPITISLGVAEWLHGDTEDSLISRADAALYAAKNAGRDRVMLARDLGTDGRLPPSGTPQD